MTLTRPLEDGLVLDLKFSEGAGTVLHDVSGERNHGVFGAGAAAPTWDTGWIKESRHALVLYEDDETFWHLKIQNGVGAYDVTLSEETSEVKSGLSSAKMVIGAGSYLHVGVRHEYLSPQDWTQYDYIILKIYGANTSLLFRIRMLDTDGDWVYWWGTDDFSGWKTLTLPIGTPSAEGGTFDVSIVDKFDVYYINVNQTFTSYLDRTIVDVAQSVLDFDGGDYVVVDHNASLAFVAEDFTVEIIARIDTENAQMLVCKGRYNADGWRLFWYTNEKVYFETNQTPSANQRTYSNILLLGNLYHIVVVRSGATATIYIDGIDDTEYHATHIDPMTTVHDLVIGASDIFSSLLDGLVALVRTYDSALSAENVALLYAQRWRM